MQRHNRKKAQTTNEERCGTIILLKENIKMRWDDGKRRREKRKKVLKTDWQTD